METSRTTPNLEIKHSRATSVLGWVTSWERAVLLFDIFSIPTDFALDPDFRT